MLVRKEVSQNQIRSGELVVVEEYQYVVLGVLSAKIARCSQTFVFLVDCMQPIGGVQIGQGFE